MSLAFRLRGAIIAQRNRPPARNFYIHDAYLTEFPTLGGGASSSALRARTSASFPATRRARPLKGARPL
jgi:hypothetical protein